MIERNLLLINSRIAQICKTYDRDSSRINLVAVSKTVEAPRIREAIALGCQTFGENYIQEAKEKWSEIKKDFPKTKLHLIGHLQSNKAAEAVELFDCIESLDSKKLASALQKEIKKQNKNPEIFIQVNVGDESQKFGVAVEELGELLEFSIKECGLNVTGLMCIPPAGELASPYFALLAKIAKTHNLKNISMGMSADFEEAIALGATHIRLGTAIFGQR